MDSKNDKTTPPLRRRERDDRPKNSPSEDFGYRISGLEKAKLEPGMTGADIAALNRAIAKLKEKKAEKDKPAEQGEE